MEKRLIAAIALSVLIIIGFQYLNPRAKQPPSPSATVSSETIATTSTSTQELAVPDKSRPSFEEKEFVAETDKHIITFSNAGGSIKNIQLKDYTDLKNDEPLELVDAQDPQSYVLALSSSSSPSALDLAEYTLSKGTNDVTYSFKAKDLEVTKRYILYKANHTIELQISIKNTASISRRINYDLIGGSHLKEAAMRGGVIHEASAKIDSKILKCKTPKSGRATNIGLVDWVALKGKYFSVILKPMTAVKTQFCQESPGKEMITGVGSDTILLQPNSQIDARFILYAGPGQIPELKKAGCGLEETVDYGFFGGISKVLIVVMNLFYKLVHSWGLSIILLSILLNIILFPLTMKSFKSIQKMQELHPQMEKLKKEHKDNPQKLNKEIMELYKKYKINPLSGCLPMLLQMPVFFALYQALMKSIELRGTKFLWIKDLSSPDAVGLPFTLPLLGDKIHILPIIMVAAMLVQQKISTKVMGSAVTDEQKQQQKMMLIMMPVMFGLIFYNMPSGLVLYWVVNTVLTIVEQSAVLKKENA